MMKPTEKRDLMKSYKRIGLFVLFILLFDAFIAFLIFRANPKFNPVLCGFIVIVITTVLYLLFLWVCATIDKKKRERIEKLGKKDPFTRQ